MPRPDVSEERKKQILDAATIVFARSGFQQARMEDIAQEAGLSKAALYLYFESKDAVITALLERFYDIRPEDFAALQDITISVSERLFWLVHFFALRLQEMGQLRPIVFEFYALLARDPRVREALTTYYDTYRAVLSALLQQGIERGEFGPMDVGEVANTIISIAEGAFLLFALQPEVVDWEPQCLSALRLLLIALRPL